MKIKTTSTAISDLRPGQIIDWQGKAHRVRLVTPGRFNGIELTLSPTLTPEDPEHVSFKASGYDSHAFTTRPIARSLQVDRMIQPKPAATGVDRSKSPSYTPRVHA